MSNRNLYDIMLHVIVYYLLRGGASHMPNIKSAKKRVKIIEKKTLENNMMFLEGVVSRKKQILPVIDKNI